jgi:excisionase family DNA binding protein
VVRSFSGRILPIEGLLTVREAAAILRVCRATVYRICERGELAHVRVSNSIRITAEALAALLHSSGPALSSR